MRKSSTRTMKVTVSKGSIEPLRLKYLSKNGETVDKTMRKGGGERRQNRVDTLQKGDFSQNTEWIKVEGVFFEYHL